jgi:hypothetical protein
MSILRGHAIILAPLYVAINMQKMNQRGGKQ